MANKLFLLDIDGQRIPFQIIEERRSSARVSLATKHVILRVPKTMFFRTDVQKHVDWAVNWIRTLKKSKPNVLDKYTSIKSYHDGGDFIIGQHSFLLQIREENRESGKIGLLKNNTINIILPAKDGYDRQKLIKNLLIKFCQKYFQSAINERVAFYNNLHFKKPINTVKLKYNKSNWGSCSTGKNLNFSVRLFFAPDDVIDYVVVHELAHLVEMNHSDRFWSIVQRIMPDYMTKEHDLKVNGAGYDF